MSDSNAPDPTADCARSDSVTAGASESVRHLAERLRAIQSVWSVLAPSCLSTNGREIVEAGRAARQEIERLAQQPGGPDDAAVVSTGTGIDALARSICRLAFEIPIPQLRATLPASLRSNRRGLLDMLDLLAGEAYGSGDPLGPKLGAIDYLITLLCTEGNAQHSAMPHDPVLLTPSFELICQRADVERDARLPEIEAEFFAAANLEEDLRDEIQRRSLRNRKAKLGKSYFAPSMLRAIITYNVALLQCAEAEVWDARDWGGDAQATPDDPAASVFDSQILRSLRASLQRRLAGEAFDTSPIGRVAWALEIDYLSAGEKSLLMVESIPSPECLPGTIALVGLLCRSLTVLSIDLQEIGISPDQISDRWAKELDQLVKREVNQNIAGDAYREACALSEMRNRFLFAPVADMHRPDRAAHPPRPRPSSSASYTRSFRDTAKDLASEALTQQAQPRSLESGAAGGRIGLSWRVLVPACAASICVALVGLHLLGFNILNGDLARYRGRDLERLSPHLVRGHRNGNGAGPAFVGTIDDAWRGLGADERRAAAEQLVHALHEQGVSQVMIYDDDDQLRIQSLGSKITTL